MEEKTRKERLAQQDLALSQARLREAHAQHEEALARLDKLPELIEADRRAEEEERAKAQRLRDEAALRRKRERESEGLE